LKEKTVEVECFDMFGLIAQGIAPETAWDAEVLSLATQPDRWFKCGQTGWMEKKTGNQWKHTGGLKKLDAVIDGADGAWGQDDPDGWGQVDEVLLDPYAGRLVISMWIDLSIVNENTYLLTQGADTLSASIRLIGSATQYLSISASDGSRTCIILVSGVDALMDLSGVHHIVLAIDPPLTVANWWSPALNYYYGTPTDPQFYDCWIDGSQVPSQGVTSATGYGTGVAPLRIGGADDTYTGVIDEVLIWQDHPDSFTDLETIAAQLYSAGSSPWANQRLDERLTDLTTALGVPNSVGALDVSGIRTLQSYAPADPIDLLQKVEDTEQGRVWIDRLGDIRFSQRSWAWDDTVSNTVQFTFSDDPAQIAGGDFQILAEGFKLTRDTREVTNVAKVNSTFGRQQIVQDDASITARGIRNPYTLSGLLHPSDRQSLSIAEWTILSRSQPQTKLTELTVSVSRNSTLYASFAQTIEEGYLVEVNREGVQYFCHVTGIKHRVTEGGWLVTLSLDSTRTGYSFFKWGTSNWGGSVGWAF
jgi:hypothetical protein